jgi:hypothetical protein
VYAKVGGISTGELNVLEREFLRMIEWRLTVSLCPRRTPHPSRTLSCRRIMLVFSSVQRGTTPHVLRQSRPFTQQAPVHHRGQPFFLILLILRTLRRRRVRPGRNVPTIPTWHSWRSHHVGHCHRCRRFRLYGRLNAIHGTAVPGTDTTDYRAEYGLCRPSTRRINLAPIMQQKDSSKIHRQCSSISHLHRLCNLSRMLYLCVGSVG